MTKYILCASLLLLVTTLLSCSDRLSPEDEIRAFITKAEKEVESRDLGGFKKLISSSYKDDNNRTQQEVIRIVAGYLMRNKNINILTRINSIQVSDTNTESSAIVYVALSNSFIPKDDLSLLQAEIHRFDLELQKTSNSWTLYSANWHRATVDDFLQK